MYLFFIWMQFPKGKYFQIFKTALGERRGEEKESK
jgi:hypothetical protein